MHPFSRSTTAVAAVTLLVVGGLAEAGTAQARVAARTVVTGGLVSPLTVGVRVQRHRLHLRELRRHAGQEGSRQEAEAGLPGHEGHRGGRGLRRRRRRDLHADRPRQGHGPAQLVMHLTHGQVTRFANTGAFERNNNPDADVTYGFRHINKRCLAKVPKQVPGALPRRGRLPPVQHGHDRHDDLRRGRRGQRHPAHQRQRATSAWSACCRRCR